LKVLLYLLRVEGPKDIHRPMKDLPILTAEKPLK